MTIRTKAFGPTALATPANALTMARLVAAPVFAVLIGAVGPSGWLLWVLWTMLAFSDSLDGQLARRHGTTRSGAFLDPLADKFLVLAALIELARLHEVAWVAVALVAAREVLVSIYRTLASRRGVSVPARPLAKAKTVFQDLAIGCCFFPPTAHHLALAQWLLWVAIALALVSAALYFIDGRRLLGPGAQPQGAA